MARRNRGDPLVKKTRSEPRPSAVSGRSLYVTSRQCCLQMPFLSGKVCRCRHRKRASCCQCWAEGGSLVWTRSNAAAAVNVRGWPHGIAQHWKKAASATKDRIQQFRRLWQNPPKRTPESLVPGTSGLRRASHWREGALHMFLSYTTHFGTHIQLGQPS